MTNGNEPRPSKNQRRDAAREKARQLREEQKKKDRRKRILLQTGIGVALIAIVAIVVVIITSSVRPAGPGPKNMASDGILFTQGTDSTSMTVVETAALKADATPTASVPDKTGNVASIVMYIDYLCPYCNQFEQTNTEQMASWVKAGAATVEIHPIALLETKSLGTKYSLRATNAAACVANYSPNDYWAFNTAMFKNQPEEGTAGLSDSEIVKVVKDAGVGAMSSVEPCIKDQTFKSWASAATDRALSQPIPNSSLDRVQGTPTVLVNGQAYSGSLTDANEFASFVLQAAGNTYSTSTPTPDPTETPAP